MQRRRLLAVCVNDEGARTMLLRRYDNFANLRYWVTAAMLVIVASIIGCGADDAAGIGGAAGQYDITEAASEGDRAGDVHEVLPDSRWDLPDVREKGVLLPVKAIACTLPSQCATGFCVDGVCCNDACAGMCMACSAIKMGQGTSGTCGFIANGFDPDDECAAGVCNGSGLCLSTCPAAGMPGSCGTANCPPCPPLVMIGTGTTGVRGSFLSSSSPAWTTSTYTNEPSNDIPSIGAVSASAQAVGLIRRTDTTVRWTRWTPAGFGAWNAVSGAPAANPVYLATNSNSYEFVTRHADGGYWQGDLAASSSLWSYSHVIKWVGVGNWWLLSGSLLPIVGFTANGSLIAYPTGSSLVVWKDTGGYATAILISTTTTRNPELATYFSGSHPRDALLVFQDNTPVTDQLYWSARQSGTWTPSAAIANAQATDQSLLALPNDDFVLAYRTPLAQVYWTRFSGVTGTWSTPQQIPGNMTALSKPSLAQGAGDAEVELLFVDSVTGNGFHARLVKGAANFTTPVAIPGATGLVGIAAATVLASAAQSTGNVCVVDADCASGHCVDGVCCDTTCASTCMACSASKKGSGSDGVCGIIATGTDPDQECGNGKTCDGHGVCRSANGETCLSASECVSNHCVDEVCCNNACLGACQACSAAKQGSGNSGVCGNIANANDPDSECSPGECNGFGACNQAQATQANGASCSFATQCASGNCVDTFCCDSTCLGLCQACSAAKKGSGVNGTCGNIIQGADPENECFNGACSGTGMCQSDNGLSCSMAAQCLSGQCVDGVCCDNGCSGTCQACSAIEKGGGSDGVCGIVASGTDPNNACALVCDAVGACVKGPIGVTCSSGADCASGFCANGFCCNSVCSGACQSCGVPGLEGRCSNGCATSCSGTLVLSQAPMSSVKVRASKGFHSADFNGDGILDLISMGDEKFVVSLGQGNGTFVPGSPQTLGPPWTYVADTAIGDLNGDSKPDVMYSANNSFIGTAILFNLGKGTFGPATKTLYASPGSDDTMGPIVLGDFDANGTLDTGAIWHHVFSFAGTKYRKQVNFGFRYNSGNGTQFSGSNLTLEDYIEEGSAKAAILLTGGDFNADGNFDIAVSRGAYPALPVYLSQGVGVFSQVTSLPTSSADLMTDINGDGHIDVPGFDHDGIFHAWFNDGTGAFATDAAYPAVNGHIHSADWNGDGAKDLVFISSATTVGVVLNQGNGTFGPREDYASPIPFDRLVVGDWNNDGRADVAVEGGSLVILLNTCMP